MKRFILVMALVLALAGTGNAAESKKARNTKIALYGLGILAGVRMMTTPSMQNEVPVQFFLGAMLAGGCTVNLVQIKF